MLFELFIIYAAAILILFTLQSNIATRVNHTYAGKIVIFSTEYKNLVKRNNDYVEVLSILLPFVDFTSFYVK
jgi:hypothetical protein